MYRPGENFLLFRFGWGNFKSANFILNHPFCLVSDFRPPRILNFQGVFISVFLVRFIWVPSSRFRLFYLPPVSVFSFCFSLSNSWELTANLRKDDTLNTHQSFNCMNFNKVGFNHFICQFIQGYCQKEFSDNLRVINTFITNYKPLVDRLTIETKTP